MQIALRSAIGVFAKANNHATAANFARRLLELNPDPKIVAQVSVYPENLSHNLRNVVYLGPPTYCFWRSKDSKPSKCSATNLIYKGLPSVHCPHMDASFLPELKGKLDPLTLLTEVGATASGLPAPR
jgi:coatomer protein complex subunit alpha (xenin)